MDYPKSVPSVGLVGGKFVDENPLTGTPGSLIPAQWGNAVCDEILNVITTAGLVPDELVNTQLATAIAGIIGSTRPLASQAEAEAGTDNAKTMTALRTQQAISKRAAVVGSSRNVRMLVAVASATATVTAEELFVKSAIGGAAWVVPSFNKVINLTTTGAGGMDTGAAPVSGFVGVYGVFNPATGASALLGVNATAAAVPEVYGGANMPVGYTASALIAVVPTNASGQFAPAMVLDRQVFIVLTQVLSTTTQSAAPVLFSISNAVPKNAKTFRGQVQVTSSAATSTIAGTFLGSSAGIGASGINTNNTAVNGGLNSPTTDIPITATQSSYYTGAASAGTMTLVGSVTSYSI